MNSPENPYAFPCSGTEGVNPESMGMSLRDWFAGQALAGLTVGVNDPEAGVIARLSYEQADAMLAARESNPPTK